MAKEQAAEEAAATALAQEAKSATRKEVCMMILEQDSGNILEEMRQGIEWAQQKVNEAAAEAARRVTNKADRRTRTVQKQVAAAAKRKALAAERVAAALGKLAQAEQAILTAVELVAEEQLSGQSPSTGRTAWLAQLSTTALE